MFKKNGQVWVETVIYTLIAFVLIGAVLSFVKPKIEEIQDKAIIEQSLSILEDIDMLILSVVQLGPANKRIIDIGLKKGTLHLDGENNLFIFEMESKHVYSEPGSIIEIGGIKALTTPNGKFNTITLTLNYSDKYNITVKSKDEIKSLAKASTPYKISISNNGKTETDVGACAGNPKRCRSPIENSYCNTEDRCIVQSKLNINLEVN